MLKHLLSKTVNIAFAVSKAVNKGTPCSIAELLIICPSLSAVRLIPTVLTIA